MSRQKYVVVGRVLLVAVAAVMLSGCFGFLKPSLTITIDPDPIEFTFADLTEEKDINIKFTTKGIGLIKIEQIVFELFEPDDDENPITSKELKSTSPYLWFLVYRKTMTTHSHCPKTCSMTMKIFTIKS